MSKLEKLAFLRGILSPENFKRALELKTLARIKNTKDLKYIESNINPKFNTDSSKYIPKILKKLQSAISPAEAITLGKNLDTSEKILYMHKPDLFSSIFLKVFSPLKKEIKSTKNVINHGKNTILNHELDEFSSKYNQAFHSDRAGHNGADVILNESNRVFYEATDSERKVMKELRNLTADELNLLKRVGVRYGEEYVAPDSKRWKKAVKNIHNIIYNNNIKKYDSYIQKITDKKPFFMPAYIRDSIINPENISINKSILKEKMNPIK